MSAYLLNSFISMILFILFMSTTIPPFTGITKPLRVNPPPKGTKGILCSLADRTKFWISSTVVGITTKSTGLGNEAPGS